MSSVYSEKYPFRDHDFVETEGGWLFCVVSDIHPEERVMAFLKYVPGLGTWRRGSQTYRRIVKSYRMEEIAESVEFVRSARPEYVLVDPYFNEKFVFVPTSSIVNHYKCTQRMREVERAPASKLEERCLELLQLLTEGSGLEREMFGLSGSLLLGLDNPNADIDFTVYGRDRFWRTLEVSKELMSPAERRKVERMLEANLLSRYPLERSDAVKLSQRCYTKGLWQGTLYSLHGVRTLEELTERYGDLSFEPLGVFRARFTVQDASQSCFTPAVYVICDGQLHPTCSGELKTLTCYDTTFATLLREGDRVECLGKLEKVVDRRDGRSYLNMLIGSYAAAGREYVRLLSPV